MVLAGLSTASAQEDDKMIFNHLGVGLALGTNGITIDASTTISPYVGVRGGVNIFPKITIGTHLNAGSISMSTRSAFEQYKSVAGITAEIPNRIDVEGTTALTTGHLLFDVYPFPQSSSFHLTAGFYFGASKVAKIQNKYDEQLLAVSQWNNFLNSGSEAAQLALQNGAQTVGYNLGGHVIVPDANGHVDASIRVAGFRPYLGLGFGRSVPRKRLGFQFDAGVQFWGKPDVYVQENKLDETEAEGDGGKALKTISKLKVWPVLNFRLVYRIF